MAGIYWSSRTGYERPVTGDVSKAPIKGSSSVQTPSAKLSQVRARVRPDIVARRTAMIDSGMKSRGLR